MQATRIDTHVADAQARLLEQYQGRPNFAAFMAAFTEQVQALEDAIFGIAGSVSLASGEAVGAQLDILGQLVGVERNGLSDAQFLALIRGTVATNNGDATLEDLLTIIAGLFLTGAIFIKAPNGFRRGPQVAPAVLSISVGDPTLPPEVFGVVETSLKTALGAGVGINYLGQFTAQAGAFACAGKQPWVRGLGSIHDATAGGGLGGLLLNQPHS